MQYTNHSYHRKTEHRKLDNTYVVAGHGLLKEGLKWNDWDMRQEIEHQYHVALT